MAQETEDNADSPSSSPPYSPTYYNNPPRNSNSDDEMEASPFNFSVRPPHSTSARPRNLIREHLSRYNGINQKKHRESSPFQHLFFPKFDSIAFKGTEKQGMDALGPNQGGSIRATHSANLERLLGHLTESGEYGAACGVLAVLMTWEEEKAALADKRGRDPSRMQNFNSVQFIERIHQNSAGKLNLDDMESLFRLFMEVEDSQSRQREIEFSLGRFQLQHGRLRDAYDTLSNIIPFAPCRDDPAANQQFGLVAHKLWLQEMAKFSSQQLTLPPLPEPYPVPTHVSLRGALKVSIGGGVEGEPVPWEVSKEGGLDLRDGVHFMREWLTGKWPVPLLTAMDDSHAAHMDHLRSSINGSDFISPLLGNSNAAEVDLGYEVDHSGEKHYRLHDLAWTSNRKAAELAVEAKRHLFRSLEMDPAGGSPAVLPLVQVLLAQKEQEAAVSFASWLSCRTTAVFPLKVLSVLLELYKNADVDAILSCNLRILGVEPSCQDSADLVCQYNGSCSAPVLMWALMTHLDTSPGSRAHWTLLAESLRRMFRHAFHDEVHSRDVPGCQVAREFLLKCWVERKVQWRNQHFSDVGSGAELGQLNDLELERNVQRAVVAAYLFGRDNSFTARVLGGVDPNSELSMILQSHLGQVVVSEEFSPRWRVFSVRNEDEGE